MTTTSVCIATFRRPRELERLLASLRLQRGAPDFEVVVVDNDPGRSARQIAQTFARDLSLVYCCETIPGVAAVRSRAVAASSGEFLAFIDDDEWATPDWLANLHAAMLETGADGVFGSIANDFAPQVPPHIRECGLFDTPTLPDRADLQWWQTRTGNAYVRRSALPDQTTPFGIEYGLTGGEDTHMFKAMLDRGSRLIWSPAAVVNSFHPLSHANLHWLFWRALRYGGTGAEVEWLHLPMRRRIKLGWRSTRHSIRDFSAAAINWRSDKAKATKLYLLATMQAGRTLRLFGLRIRIYSRASQAGAGR